jgi:hypothetical protein
MDQFNQCQYFTIVPRRFYKKKLLTSNTNVDPLNEACGAVGACKAVMSGSVICHDELSATDEVPDEMRAIIPYNPVV